MTQLVFHIGDPKTGTSSIQAALWNNLCHAEGQTIRSFIRINAARFGTNLQSRNADACDQHFREIKAWLNEATEDFSVISGETISFAPPKFLARMVRSHLPEHADRFRVISYVRPHASRMVAAFVQRTKMGGILEEEFTAFRDKMTQEGTLFHYAPRFAKWSDTMGTRFELLPFVRSELKNEDAVQDFFFRLLGQDKFTIDDREEENVTLHLRGLVSLKVFRRVLAEQGIDLRHRKILGATLATDHITRKPQTGPKPYIDKRSAQIMIDTFLKDAQEMDRRYFGKPILEPELLKSIETKHNESFSMAEDAYFSDAEIHDLSNVAREFANHCKEIEQLWTHHTKTNRGMVRVGAAMLAKLNKNAAQLRQVDEAAEAFSAIVQG